MGQYQKSFSLHWGAFNWEMHFRWFVMGVSHIDRVKKNSTLPYGTPVMAGGLFSIQRKYFWDSGSYDEKMDIWGGENLEMSFRIWQCGGRVEIAPCSRWVTSSVNLVLIHFQEKVELLQFFMEIWPDWPSHGLT